MGARGRAVVSQFRNVAQAQVPAVLSGIELIREEHYLKADFDADAVRPKSENTKTITEHIVRDYLVVRWGSEIAEDITSLDILALA